MLYNCLFQSNWQFINNAKIDKVYYRLGDSVIQTRLENRERRNQSL